MLPIEGINPIQLTDNERNTNEERNHHAKLNVASICVNCINWCQHALAQRVVYVTTETSALVPSAGTACCQLAAAPNMPAQFQPRLVLQQPVDKSYKRERPAIASE